MTLEKKAHTDPLIDEVRERRRELLAEYGYDLKKFCEMLQSRQAEHPEKMVDRRKSKRPIASK